MGEKKLKHEMI